MNELIEKNLGEDKNMEFRKNDIELINKYRDSDNLFIYLNKNKPILTDEDKKQLEGKTDPFSDLDKLERCGVAFTCIVGKKLNSSSGNQKFKSRIKPTAWKSIGCDYIEDGKCLYNRCHLIGRQLYVKKADKRGLITGTRKFNMEGMLQFEDKAVKYINDNPDHHILYRVTPYFGEDNLLAYGVQMEMLDIDNEENFSYNVFAYNKQLGFILDYENGDVYSDYSLSLSGKRSGFNIYVIDRDANKFHKETCASVSDIENKKYFVGGKQRLETKYCKCEICIF